VGISASGVRQIAEAHGKEDQDQVARVVRSLRRTVWITGMLGMGITILASTWLSRISFESGDHAIAIALLGVTILLANISTGQSCILQGTRRIADLARVSIIGALAGTLISVPCYYFWGRDGIVPGLILTAVANLGTAWWYARKVTINPVTVSWNQTRTEATKMLKFGLPLMLAGLLTVLTGYLIRIVLVRQVGLDGVGIWQAAFNLSALLVNFVLGAMAADYYPRLTAVAHDNTLISQKVNEQTEIALLLAVPGLAATIIFAPIAITIFYSGRFDAAVDVLRWSVYGIFGRIVSWPLGFIMLAKGMGKTYFCSETFANGFYLAGIWLCVKIWGLPGTGIAFLFLYVAYTILVYIIGYKISRTRWNRANVFHIVAFTSILAVIGLISALVHNPWYQYPVNTLFLAGLSVYCLGRLSQKSGVNFNQLFSRFYLRKT
jgi:PST family polysaccharide transporter